MLLRETAPFEVMLNDELPVRLRPVESSDRSRAQQAYSQLSERSRLNRFWQNTMHLSADLAEKLTATDDSDHLGWVALPVGEDAEVPGYGAASFWRASSGSERAEFAITVIDEWQRKGFGALLFAILWHEAWELGIRRFEAVARRDNAAMIHWWESAGGESVETTMQHELTLELEEPEAFASRIEYDLHAGKIQGEIALWFQHFTNLQRKKD